MNNPFQEQLLKAGVVTKEQVKKAQKQKKKNSRQQRGKKGSAPDEAKLKARQAAEEQARRDRELNRKKEQQVHKRAIAAEIKQIIADNRIERKEDCEIAYNFTHANKVKTIYVDNAMRQQIIQGKMGIAAINGSYELVPLAAAEKIRQRDESRVILFGNEPKPVDEDDPYAGYQVPDDLVW